MVVLFPDPNVFISGGAPRRVALVCCRDKGGYASRVVPQARSALLAVARGQDDLLASTGGPSVLRRRVSRRVCSPYEVSKRARKAGWLVQPNVF